MKKLYLSSLFLMSTAVFASDLPNPHLTPGATNPSVTQANISQTICISGYTATIRPPVAYTNNLKKLQIREYGYSDTNLSDYEEDHLIALSIGGSPTDPKNLWPQPRNSRWGSAEKDKLELVMYKMVCNHTITLQQAQKEMATDWVSAYKRYVLNK